MRLLLPRPLAGADGEKERPNNLQWVFWRPLSQPHPLADVATLRCKLAKASLLGEEQSEGAFAEAIEPTLRISRQVSA